MTPSRFSNSSSTWGVWNRTQYLSYSLTSIEFPLIAVLLAFLICKQTLGSYSSWQPVWSPDLFSKAVQLVCSQAPLKCLRTRTLHFMRFLLAYSSSLSRSIWVESLFGESITLPCLVSSTNFLRSHSVLSPRLLLKVLYVGPGISLCGASYPLPVGCWAIDYNPLSSAVQPVAIQSNRPFLQPMPFQLTNESPVGNWISPNR